MTRETLEQYYDLQVQLNEARELRQTLEARSMSHAQLTGMPRGSPNYDKLAILATELADCDAEIQRITQELETIREQVDQFIDAIPQLRIKRICRYRLQYGLPWKEVAANLGKYETDQNTRNTFYRYMNKYLKQPQQRPPCP